MDVKKLIEENPNINITINASDLLEFGNSLANETAIAVLEKKEEKLYTRKEVVKLFDVSYATIWRWQKLNLIKSKKIGQRVYYPESEIKRLTTLKTA